MSDSDGTGQTLQANKVVGAIGMAGALGIGSWWIAEAVSAGSPLALAMRVVLVVGTAIYYLALYRARFFQTHRYR